MPPLSIDILIMAAGSGDRAGGDVPKQYQSLAGVPMLRRVVEIYRTHPAVRNIHIVIGAGQEKFYTENLPFIIGGARRQDSVRLGLAAMAANAPDYVLIIDAARPFTSQKIIDDTFAALAPDTAVLTAVPLTDTLKHQHNAQIKTIARDNYYLAQTPQGFPFQKILQLHEKMQGTDFTDDVALFETAGLPVKIIPGSTRNIKITTAEDFQMAEAMLNTQTETRIGHGYDVHRFKPGNHIWLSGIRIPHTHGVAAHSDGDVVLHALTDALLGTIGAGDIGMHFPPSDPKWQGASSDQFVTHAMQHLRARGGTVINADITILCEVPRIGAHRATMQTRIAELLGVATDRVNIKATTTEKLGAIGRGEGLAAAAMVLVRLATTAPSP